MANVTVDKVRFMYNFVFEPRLNKMNGKEEFFVRVLIPKTNKEAIKILNDAIHATASDKWGAKVEQMLKTVRLPLMDGDQKGDPNYAGMLYFNAKSDRKPTVVDISCKPIMRKEEFYSGCWGAFNGNVWAYDNAFGKGISIGLQNLMKTKDDEPIASGVSAQEVFGNIMQKASDTEDISGLM